MNHRNPHITPDIKATNTCLLGNNMFTIRGNDYLTNRQQIVYSHLVSPHTQVATNACQMGNKCLPFEGLGGDVGTTPLQFPFFYLSYLVATPIYAIQSRVGRVWCAATGSALLLLLLVVVCYQISVMCYLLWVICCICNYITSYIYNNNAIACNGRNEKTWQYFNKL